jgi:hypothetical protein
MEVMVLYEFFFGDGFQGTLDEGCVMLLWVDLYDFKLHELEKCWSHYS